MADGHTTRTAFFRPLQSEPPDLPTCTVVPISEVTP